MALEKKLDLSKIDKKILNEIRNRPPKSITWEDIDLPVPKGLFEGDPEKLTTPNGMNLSTLIFDKENDSLYNLNGDQLLEVRNDNGTYKIINRAKGYISETDELALDKENKVFIDAKTKTPLIEFTNYNDLKANLMKSESLVDKLLKTGFHEAHAEFIAENLEVESGKTIDLETKNQVYFLKDIYGNKKVIKFVDSKKEAELEVAVNKKFGEHHVLKQYVAGTDQDTPIEFEINGETKYAVIQNDITHKAFPEIEKAMLKNEKSRHQYVEHWMRTLARIHHYGSEIMSELGMTTPAETISCMPGREKDLMRLEDCAETRNNLDKIKDLVEEATTYQTSFIHFDAKPENRMGTRLIDWGNAGWGSHYLDVSMILNDTRIPLSNEEKEHFVKQYIQQRNELIKQERSNHPFMDEKEGIQEYKNMEFLINSTFTAYYASKGMLRNDEQARKDLIVLNNKNSAISKNNKTYILENIKTITKDGRKEIYLPSPNELK